MKSLMVMLCIVSLSAFGADRIINQTVDTTTARVQPAAIGFFRGESVDYTVTPRLGTLPITVSTNATATWTVTTQTNVLVGVLQLSGVVSTNGVCVFSAVVSNTTMAAGTYDSFVRIQDGAELVTASRTTLNVYKSPYSEAVTVLPYSLVGAVLSNQMGSGATWTGSNWVFSGSGSMDYSVTNNLASIPYVTNALAPYAKTADLPADDLAWTNKLDPSATNALASTSCVANAVSGLVSNTDSRLTDNRTDGAAWHYGDSVTGAVDQVARGLTNYDAYGSALAVSNAFTNAAAKANSALQGEADTLESVIARGGSFTNRIPYKYAPAIIAGMIGTSPATRMLDSGGIGFTCSNTLDNVVVTNTFYAHGTSHGTDFYHTYGSESTLFNRYVLFYDSDNFVAGVNYLAPDGNGTNLTSLDLNPSLTGTVAKAASALQTVTAADVVAAGGVTGTPWVVTTPIVTNLTYSSTNIVSDFSVAKGFRVTLTNNAYLVAPTNATDGQVLKWWIKQGAPGNRTLATAPSYVFPSGTTNLSLSTNSLATDLLIGEYDSVSNVVRLTGLLLYSR